MIKNEIHKSIMPKEGKKGEPSGGARAGTLIICPGKLYDIRWTCTI